jgi:hypothetical protein
VRMHINNQLIQIFLTSTGEYINIMDKETMEKLKIQGLLMKNPSVLQVASNSTIKPKGMLEDVVVSIDCNL